MKKYISSFVFIPFFSFLVLPFSDNYKLKSYEFGSGGDSLTSSAYSLEGQSGELSGQGLASSIYKMGAGLIFMQQAHVPPAPTFVNTGSWYNKLKITINKDAADPTDATYAIAITDDDWVTTEWVQNNNTIGATLGIEDFQTYVNWGGASGEFIIGLNPDTTYKVKVKSRQGLYTESPLGPEASATTSNVAISFDLDVAPTDQESAAPYAVSFGDLTVGSVSTATDKVWIDLTTNAESGGYVYVSSINAGLKSTALNYTIDAVSSDLVNESEGFGIQSFSEDELSGGPFVDIAPYNGVDENVGLTDNTIRELYSTSGNPITTGRAAFVLKSKSSASTPAADDYAETLILITSATF